MNSHPKQPSFFCHVLLIGITFFSLSGQAQNSNTEQFFTDSIKLIEDLADSSTDSKLDDHLDLAVSMYELYRYLITSLDNLNDNELPKNLTHITLFSQSVSAYRHSFETTVTWQDIALALEKSETQLRDSFVSNGGATPVELIIQVMGNVLTSLTKYLSLSPKFRKAFIEAKRLAMAKFFISNVLAEMTDDPILSHASHVDSRTIIEYEADETMFTKKMGRATGTQIIAPTLSLVSALQVDTNPTLSIAIIAMALAASHTISNKYFEPLSELNAASMKRFMSQTLDAPQADRFSHETIRRGISFAYFTSRAIALATAGGAGLFINADHPIAGGLSLIVSGALAVLASGLQTISSSGTVDARNKLLQAHEARQAHLRPLTQNFLEAYDDVFSNPDSLETLFIELGFEPNRGMGEKLLAFAWGYFTQVEQTKPIRAIETFAGGHQTSWQLGENQNWGVELKSRFAAFVESTDRDVTTLWNQELPVHDGAFTGLEMTGQNIQILATPLSLDVIKGPNSDRCTSTLVKNIQGVLLKQCRPLAR